MGFFHFPKFRITCIIRNICNQKREAALLSLSDFRQLLWMLFSLHTRASTPLDILPVCSSVRLMPAVAVPVRYKSCYKSSIAFSCFGDTMLISPAAVLCQSMHRWLRNKCAPQSCSSPRCRSALHPRHSLQSTALPALPDNPHLPAA